MPKLNIFLGMSVTVFLDEISNESVDLGEYPPQCGRASSVCLGLEENKRWRKNMLVLLPMELG